MIALLLPVVLASAPAGGKHPVRVGIVSIEARDDLDDITSAVLFALDDPKRFVAVDANEMAKHIDAAASLGIRCAGADAACFARVGAFAKTPLLLFVSADAESARAIVVDAATSTSRAAASPLSEDGAQKSATISALVRAALDNTPPRATLSLLSSGEETSVDVDGAPRGAPPLTLDDLAPGTHAIRVHAKDGRERTETIELYAGVVVTMETTLPPPVPDATAPPIGEQPESSAVSPLLVTGGVIAGVGAIASIATVGSALIVTPDPARRSEYTAREFNDANATAASLWVGAGLSAAVIVVGAGLAGAALAMP